MLAVAPGMRIAFRRQFMLSYQSSIINGRIDWYRSESLMFARFRRKLLTPIYKLTENFV